jgi:hypothetical protein
MALSHTCAIAVVRVLTQHNIHKIYENIFLNTIVLGINSQLHQNNLLMNVHSCIIYRMAAGLQWKYFLEVRQKDCNEKPETLLG